MRPTGQAAASLGAVDLGETAASVWNCPGPLPLGGSASSTIALSNPGGGQATARLLVVEEAAGGRGGERSLSTAPLSVPPRSERNFVLPAPSTGSVRKRPARSQPPSLLASVSVTTQGKGVAVDEVAYLSGAVLNTPCLTGEGERAYIASGVTAGASSDEVALFNPSASPAVADVSIGTESGLLAPPDLQGLVVAPQSTRLLDMARYAPARERIAVAVRTTLGRLVAGSLTEISTRRSSHVAASPRRTRKYYEKGAELCVGVSSPTLKSVFPVLAGRFGAQAVRVFNPGSKPATVLVATGGKDPTASSLTISLGPGRTTTAYAPVQARKAGPGGIPGGLVTVTSENRQPIVVESETTDVFRSGRLIGSASPVPFSSRSFVIPGALRTPWSSERIVVVNPSARPVRFSFERLPPRLEPRGWRAAHFSEEVGPRSTRVVGLQYLASPAGGYFGVEVRATGRVLVGGELVKASGRGQPMMTAGVPLR
jgi:hypothetical protein